MPVPVVVAVIAGFITFSASIKLLVRDSGVGLVANEGHGATFGFSIPLAETTDAAAK
jgi:hypothetical protein